MYFIGADDGSNVGPFQTERSALLHFVEALSLVGLPQYADPAVDLLRSAQLADPDEWKRAARRLLNEVDSFVWRIEIVSGTGYGEDETGRNGFTGTLGAKDFVGTVIGCSSIEEDPFFVINSPEDNLTRARKWAAQRT